MPRLWDAVPQFCGNPQAGDANPTHCHLTADGALDNYFQVRGSNPVTAGISNCRDGPPTFTGCAASQVSANWRDDGLEKRAQSRTSRVCQTVHPQADLRRYGSKKEGATWN